MRTFLAVATAGMLTTACAETTRDPVSSPGSTSVPRTSVSTTSGVVTIAELNAEFGVGMWSLDSTTIGNSAPLYVPPEALPNEETTICRDHLKAVDLWWDGGYGIASFHLNPPILFVGYRAGAVRSGVLGFRRAIYESMQPSEATDPAGNVWRFQGRFNALCRHGEYEIGPIAFRGQVVRSQDPIDRPVLVSRGDLACGAGGDVPIDLAEYDPYAATRTTPPGGSGDEDCGGTGSGGGTQYEPGDNTGGETVDWLTGTGTGGRSACGDNAIVEYVCIDEWVEGTGWVEWGCGYVTTC